MRSFVAEARKRVGPKRARIVPIIERLLVEHADATIALTFRNELELRTRNGLTQPVTADFFPAYDEDGGLLVALSRRG